MANPTEASLAAAPSSVPQPPGPTPVEQPLPERPVTGTSQVGTGVHGQSFDGAGVVGEGHIGGVSGGDGVLGEGHFGVRGVSTGSGDGVTGSSPSGNGVIGLAGGAPTGGGTVNGVIGRTTSGSASGVWGDNTGSGYGVAGSSAHGNGVIGLAAGAGPGAAGAPPGGDTGNGVIGRTTSGTASGVWGENTGAGYAVGGKSAGGHGVHGESVSGVGIYGAGGFNGVQGVTGNSSASGVWGENAGAGFGVGGKSASGQGVHGESGSDVGIYGQGGFNGVQGVTANSSASGVWGENTGAGYGVGGQSASGVGIYGKGTPAGQFDGNVVINGGSLTMQNGGDIILADFAEDFDATETGAGPGTVMVIGDDENLRPCDLPYDKRVAGVVSGAGNFRPGIVLGKQRSKDNTVPIALVGKVYCKVDATYSAIDVGDLLTSSPTLGHAMKAGDRVEAFGAVLGKALSPLPGGQGMIPVLVALQ